MSSLREFLEIQRQENEVLKSEIEMQLENLFNPLDEAMQMLDDNPVKYSNLLSKLCQFEQKMNHKLLEINFELKKFRMLFKFPEYHSPVVKTPPEDELDDIETLKANSSELILRLEKLQGKNMVVTENKVISDTTVYAEEKPCAKIDKEIMLVSLDSFINSKSSPDKNETELGDNTSCEKNCDHSVEMNVKSKCEENSEEKFNPEFLVNVNSEITETGDNNEIELCDNLCSEENSDDSVGINIESRCEEDSEKKCDPEFLETVNSEITKTEDANGIELCDNLCFEEYCDDFVGINIKSKCEEDSEKKSDSDFLETVNSEKTKTEDTKGMELHDNSYFEDNCDDFVTINIESKCDEDSQKISVPEFLETVNSEIAKTEDTNEMELCGNSCFGESFDDSVEINIEFQCEEESEEKSFCELPETVNNEKIKSEGTNISEKESAESSISEEDFLGGEYDSDHETLNTEELKDEVDVDKSLNNSENIEQIDAHTYFCEKYDSTECEDANISNSGSDLFDFMWKNVIELGMVMPKDLKITKDLDSLPSKDVTLEPSKEEKNVNDKICIESELILEEIPTTDNDSSKSKSYCEVLPESGYSETEEMVFSTSEGSFGSEKQFIDQYTPQDEVQKQTETLCNTNIEISSNKVEKVADSSNDVTPSIEKTDASQTIFTAEQKIKRLGLEDRFTLFERTRKMAALPDLRLQPVDTPVGSDKSKKKKYEINEESGILTCVQPTEGMTCVFSHVESPSEFYLHPHTEEVMLIDSLNDLITNHYKTTKSTYISKKEAINDIKQFCCVFLKDLKMYYRAEVIDWLQDDDKLVTVQLVDYGNYQVVHYKNLRKIDYMFTLLPKLAMKCFFPLLYPPGSTKTNILAEWPRSSIDALFDLSGLGLENKDAFFKLVHVEIENNELAVDLTQINEPYSNTVGQLLVDLGHAVQIIFPEDDPMGILSDEEDIKNLERCNNLNEVILGYDPKDEARICKFSKKDGGKCHKRACRFEHVPLNKGGFTTDKVLTYCEALTDLKLPKFQEYTSIRLTTFVDATKYYGIIMSNMEDLRHLEVIMNDPINCSKFEQFKVLPARGEIVIVQHWQKRWLRAKIRHHLYNEKGDCTGAQVFMVDYGDTIDARLENIRKIKKDYLNLPFQAVECEMANYRKSPSYIRKEMEIFFYQNMVFRFFTAKVIAWSDMQLCLEFYYHQRVLGDILAEYGFLERAEKKSIYPHSKSPLIPG